MSDMEEPETLTVGINDAGEVVINHESLCIVLTQAQARDLANILIVQATQAELLFERNKKKAVS